MSGTINQRRAKSTEISDHLQRRPHKHSVRAAVRRVREQRRVQRELRAGGLPAEKVADRALATESRGQVRALILARTGRRIDLVSLLRQRRPDGRPRWALADPLVRIDQDNGAVDERGNFRIAESAAALRCRGSYVNSSQRITIRAESKCHNVQPTDAFPALPPRVRELAADPKIRRRAEFVGVLYQPEEWREVNPDPALVVKWRGVDGFFALAVWGGDRAELMEFVD